MSVIKRCIEELASPSPRIPYVLGMLETYYELSGEKAKDEKSLSVQIPATTATPSSPGLAKAESPSEIPVSPAFKEFAEKVKNAKPV